MTGRLTRRLAVLGGGLAALVATSVALATPAAAHPLGNFTVNQYSGLRLAPAGVTVDYVLDLAEIPTYQLRTQEMDKNGDGTVSADELAGWQRRTCAAVAGQLRLLVTGRPASLAVTAAAARFLPGAAGLVTTRLSCTLRAAATLDRPTHVSYRDDAYADRIGWREVTAVGDRATLTGSTVAAASRSNRLTAYPADLLSSPLDERGAELDVRPGGPRLAVAPPTDAPSGSPLARGADRATVAFTALIARQRLTVAFGLLAVLLSILLGALHALAPGHGKTVMAAVLVGQRGSIRQAVTIGLTVTLTHTAGVLVLGVALTTSVAFAPQRLYPWLGTVSGLLLASVGVSLFRRARRAGGWGHRHDHPHPVGSGHSQGSGDQHSHPHGSGHSDGVGSGHSHGVGRGHSHGVGSGHTHGVGRGHSVAVVGPDHSYGVGAEQSHVVGLAGSHEHDAGREHWHPRRDHANGRPRPDEAAVSADAVAGVRRRSLLAMGFAGGLVPSPSALVVLLGAVALGRAWLGVLLVIGYGTGMASALVGIGLLLARGRHLLERRMAGAGIRRTGRARRLTIAGLMTALPRLAAATIVVVGLGLAAQAVAALVAA